MYEIKIKGMRESFTVEDKDGKAIAEVFFDDKKYSETQKISIKNWMGTKGEIKTVYHIKEESNSSAQIIETRFSPADLMLFRKEILPFTEKRVWQEKEFDYLTKEGELKFLETKGVVSFDNPKDLKSFRVTNPVGYFGMRDKIAQLFRMDANREYAENKKLKQLDDLNK